MMSNPLTPYLCKFKRNARGLSLRDLSRAARVREVHLRLYEANRYDLSDWALERLSAALGSEHEAPIAAQTSEEAANAAP